MRLSAFIISNMEAVLQEWEDFARSLGTVTKHGEDWLELTVADVARARDIVRDELALGAELEAFTPNREDLEALFVRTLGPGATVEEGRP